MKVLRVWNPRADIAQECAVWRRMETELCRQITLRCHTQGDLLNLTLKRRDTLHQVLLASTSHVPA